MKSKKRTIGILIVVIVILFGFVGSLLIYRNKLESEKTKSNSSNNTAQSISSAPSGKSIENFYDKPITDEKIALDSIEVNRNKLGYSDKNFTFIYDEKSGSETAYHFDLYYKGIPVQSPGGIRGVSVITHYDNSAKVLITGVSDSRKITKINTMPKITQDEAGKIIKNELNLSEKTYIEPKLIIYEVNEECILAYYVNTLFNVCIINAENGNIVVCQSTLLSNSDEFIGQNGDKHRIFYDDYQDGNYNIENALWDKEKNIFIYNNICKYEEIKMKENILSLKNLQSGKNKSAVDGMANTYRAVEFFENLKKFDSVVVVVNIDRAKDENGQIIKDNASGSFCNLDGKDIAIVAFYVSSKEEIPQYSAYLDAVAHEYTHAVTNSEIFGSDGYSKDSKFYEQNALMEAYSDIFGELVEQEYTGKTDWNSNKTRNLIEQEKDREYYNYKYSDVYIGTDDYGGAHYNSTVISHTAYLMSKDHKSIKHSSYGSTKNLLDYNQLAQLWYGSLEYLKKTEFKDFADCRYAVEESARDLIEKGILVEDNLKVIEQAFNEVGVSSNPARRGAIDSAEIKKKHNVEVPIEDETNSTEMVEIEEIDKYEWHLAPTIEAEDIIVSDSEKVYNFSKNPFDEYSIVKQNGKFIFINYDGTYISDKQYDKWYFSKPNAITCSSKNNDCITILGENGNEISYEPHDSGWGSQGFYIDNKTKEIYSTEYGSASKYNESDNVVVQSADVTITSSKQNISTFELNNVGKYGIANCNGIVVDCFYDDACMNIGENIIALQKDGNWGYFNKDGTQIINFVCESFESKILDVIWIHNHDSESVQHPFLSSNGYIPIKINGQCGYYDTQGNEIIPCGTFEEVRPVHNGLAWVKKDGKWGVIKLKDIEVTTSSIELKEIKSDNKMGEVKIEDGYLNIRDKPSTKGKIIGKLYNGDRVTIEESSADGKWLKIMKEDIKGYVSKDYIKILEDIEQGTEQVNLTINGNYSWTSEQVINSVNAYLKENWCGENQYYCFESELIENEGYWWVCIRWDGSNSANVITGNDCKINKETGEVEISFNGKPYEWFNLKDYQ